MKILLHLGVWKTGSSAIQITLRREAEALAQHGIVTPAYAAAEHGTHAIANAAPRGEVALAPLLADIAETGARHPGATVVVSSEHLWPLGPAQVRRLCRLLLGLTEEIEALIYVRAQDELWTSVYAQCARMLSVRAHDPRWGTADYTGERLAAAFDFHAALRPWANGLGRARVRVRPYDRALFPEGDGVRDFLAIATPPGVTPFVPEGKDLHRSLGWKGVALAIACNDRLRAAVAKPSNALLERHRRAVMRAVSAMAKRYGEEGWRGRAPAIFDHAERERVRAHYARANRRLFDAYFDGEDVFRPPSDAPRDPISLFALPDEEREAALGALIAGTEATPRRPGRPVGVSTAPVAAA